MQRSDSSFSMHRLPALTRCVSRQVLAPAIMGGKHVPQQQMTMCDAVSRHCHMFGMGVGWRSACGAPAVLWPAAGSAACSKLSQPYPRLWPHALLRSNSSSSGGANHTAAALPVASLATASDASPRTRFRTAADLVACLRRFNALREASLSDVCEVQVQLALGENKVHSSFRLRLKMTTRRYFSYLQLGMKPVAGAPSMRSPLFQLCLLVPIPAGRHGRAPWQRLCPGVSGR